MYFTYILYDYPYLCNKFVMKLAALGRESNFETLFKANYLRLYHYAHRMVDDDEVCRDIVEDAFEQFWKKMDDIAVENQQGYIFMLVRNKCIDHTRHAVARNHYADFFKHTHTESHTHDDWELLLQTERYIDTVHLMIEELPEKTQFILKECFFKERTYVDVAKQLGVSATAVRKHILRALHFFRSELSKKSE